MVYTHHLDDCQTLQLVSAWGERVGNVEGPTLFISLTPLSVPVHNPVEGVRFVEWFIHAAVAVIQIRDRSPIAVLGSHYDGFQMYPKRRPTTWLTSIQIYWTVSFTKSTHKMSYDGVAVYKAIPVR